MSKTIINGVDVSEEIRYCNNCSNLGLDFEARKFYCSLSHRPDELPEVLSCDEFSANCYIKRLQEENEELKERKDKYYLRTLDYETEISYLVQALEEIRKLVKEQCESNCGLKLKYCMKQEGIKTCLIYKIKNEINEVLNDRD